MAFTMKSLTGMLVLAFICLKSSYVQSIELIGDLYSEVRFTDNVDKTATDGTSDTVQTIGAVVAVEENRKNFQTNANIRLEKESYYEDSFEGNTSLTTGFGLINLGLIDQFIDWKASVSRSELLNDPLDEDVPDNRGFRTIVKTGPTINYNISRSTNMNLELEYQNVENSDPAVRDSERASATFNMLNLYNQLTSFTASLNATDAFDSDGGDEFQRGSLNVGLVRQFNRGDFALKYGQTRIKPDDGNDASSAFYEVLLNRQDFYFHDLSFTANRNITDTGIGFDDDALNAGDGEALDGTDGNDFITRERYTLKVFRALEAYNYQIDLSLESEDYDVRASDERTREVGIEFNQPISEDLAMGYSYNYLLKNFVDDPDVGKENTQTYRTQTTYKIGRDINLSGFLQYSIRDNEIAPSRDFEEWSLGIGFNWAFLN